MNRTGRTRKVWYDCFPHLCTDQGTYSKYLFESSFSGCPCSVGAERFGHFRSKCRKDGCMNPWFHVFWAKRSTIMMIKLSSGPDHIACGRILRNFYIVISVYFLRNRVFLVWVMVGFYASSTWSFPELLYPNCEFWAG
jgi:hypothetical protein